MSPVGRTSPFLLLALSLLAKASPSRADEGDEPVPAASVQAPADGDEAALQATIARLEARLAALEAEVVAVAPAPPPLPPAPPDGDAAECPSPAALDGVPGADEPLTPSQRRWRALLDARSPRWWDALDLRVSGYVQAQAEFHELSQDELSPDGGALNQDRFLVRRGRLRVERLFRYAHAALELDANTVRGPFVSLRRAEVSFFLPNRKDGLPPYVMATLGLSEIPFGFELRQGPRQRVFMERTTASLAFFRGEPDVGVRLSGAVGPFRYAVAAQNGVPLDDRPGGGSVVYNHQKTGVGRLGFEVKRPERYEVSGGASFLAGTGFHAGTPESKAGLSWRDLNQDGNVTLNELVAVPAQAATPSSTFPRWAVGADLQVGFHTRLGWTRLYGELTMATNLDRSLFVADPVATGYDRREVAWYGAFVQELTPYALIGFRADGYDPDADLFEARRGVFVATKTTITTLSPVFGLQLPRRGRLLAQYDRVLDQLGRDDRGEPTALANDAWTVRLQVEF